MTQFTNKYDLEERTAILAEEIIRTVKAIKLSSVETKHWLRLLAVSNPEIKEKLRNLYKETHELLLIFSKILKSSRENKFKNYKIENSL